MVIQGTIVNPESRANSLFSTKNIADNLAAARDHIINPSFNIANDIASLGSGIARGVGKFIGTENTLAQNPQSAWMKNAGAIPVA